MKQVPVLCVWRFVPPSFRGAPLGANPESRGDGPGDSGFMLRMPRNDGSNREGQDMSADCPPLNFTRWRGYGFASNPPCEATKLNPRCALGNRHSFMNPAHRPEHPKGDNASRAAGF